MFVSLSMECAGILYGGMKKRWAVGSEETRRNWFENQLSCHIKGKLVFVHSNTNNATRVGQPLFGVSSTALFGHTCELCDPFFHSRNRRF